MYLSLSELLALVSAGSVSDECGVLSFDGDEILLFAILCELFYQYFNDIATTYNERQITDLNVVQRPFAEKLYLSWKTVCHGLYV